VALFLHVSIRPYVALVSAAQHLIMNQCGTQQWHQAAYCLFSPRTMDRTWGQDGGGSGCKRLFCCCSAAAKLVRSLPAVQPAPLRQDTPLIAAELGSPILEPNLQEDLLITTAVTKYSHHQIKY